MALGTQHIIPWLSTYHIIRYNGPKLGLEHLTIQVPYQQIYQHPGQWDYSRIARPVTLLNL